MFEDAFVVGDPDAVARLFEDGGAARHGERRTRSGEAIGPFAAALWAREVGLPRRTRDASCRRATPRWSSPSAAINVAAPRGRRRLALRDLAAGCRRHDPRRSTTHEHVATERSGAGEGEARWWFGALAVIKATAQTPTGS